MTTLDATTYQARCRLAASYVERYAANPGTFWMAIAKPTSWYNDSDPPYVGITITELPEVIGFCYVHTCINVYADSAGSLVTPNGKFTSIANTDPEALSSAKANKVYFESILDPSSTATGSTYRMKGLCTDVIYDHSAAPNPTVGTYIPASAVSYYFLDWISTHTPVTNDGVSNQVIQVVREF